VRDFDGEAGLIDWVLREATAHDDLGALLTGVCERLRAAGVPVWRASLDVPTIDPNARALAHKWWRDRPGSTETLPHGPEQDGVFQRSVIFHLLSHGLYARRWRLECGEGVEAFDLLRTLRREGATDYVARLVGFGDGARPSEAAAGAAPPVDSGTTRRPVRGVALSVATDRAGGFADDEIARFDRLLPALGLASHRVSAARTAADALSVYLGPRTARRVLAGRIRRGEGERIAAAILLADLKRFTALSEREDALSVVRWLDEHFEAVGDAVAARGGEILKFTGDGLLAVFPAADPDREPCPACADALRAAEEAVAANEALNAGRREAGGPVLALDVALHFGEAVYGNVGASRRLDFTVIGRAVNEVSRMEALCDEVGRNIVLSETFARRCARPTVAVGTFALRDIAGDRTLYAIR
jgi:adenylate cyclase